MGKKTMRVRSGASDDSDDRLGKILKYAGLAALGAAVAGAVAVWFARDQMARHRRDLFSPHPLRRLAALGYLRTEPNVDNVLLLRDFLAWEQRPLIRKRAASILEEMEERLRSEGEAEHG